MMSVAVAAEAWSEEPVDFELVSDDGRFVRLSSLAAQTTMIVFWASDCPACMREIPLLHSFAGKKSNVRYFHVQLDAEDVTPRPPGTALKAPRSPKHLLRRFGNRSGAIPFTVVLNGERVVCARRLGIVNRGWLNEVAHQCLGDGKE